MTFYHHQPANRSDDVWAGTQQRSEMIDMAGMVKLSNQEGKEGNMMERAR